MVDIVVGGLCQVCGRYSIALYTCKSCGGRVCMACVEPTGYCKACGGIKRVNG